MLPRKTPHPSVQQTAIGDGNVQIAGDNNTVNQTIIQKFINIFRGNNETLEQRNRRIMLGHVENFWVKGILEKSLYGAALLELGIKENPDALKYPWAIKREASPETLPAGTSMLEIYEQIGMGRSLLILGAPGSGKTTMLLDLTRQLIERACQDVTEPIPVVFNLSTWTEKFTIADWLVAELNFVYHMPPQIALSWISKNEMILLLDGLDEVRQESRSECVDALNKFRIGYGITGLAVCSRSQEYVELNKSLAFDGAIEIQPLTSKQINMYFNRFGKGLAGVKQILKKDSTLREMAESPLFLSVMALAYRDKAKIDILVSEDAGVQRKYLLDAYIARMFERHDRSRIDRFKKQDVLCWLSWLACSMIAFNQIPYLLERMQPNWLGQRNQFVKYGRTIMLFIALIYCLLYGLLYGVILGPISGLFWGPFYGLFFGLFYGRYDRASDIHTVDALAWNWQAARTGAIVCLCFGLLVSRLYGLPIGLIFGASNALILGLYSGLKVQQVERTILPGQKITFSLRNYFFVSLLYGLAYVVLIGLACGLVFTIVNGLFFELAGRQLILLLSGPFYGLLAGVLYYGLVGGLLHSLRDYGGISTIKHYALRYFLSRNNHIPWRLIPFLDYCCDLIFLRRVGGGYIFVHRLLMEHFAEMYPDSRGVGAE